jgi:hypothetical protein
MNWDKFLRQKAATIHVYRKRRAQIIAWQNLHKKDRSPVNPALLDRAEESIRRVIRAYDIELAKLRVAADKQRNAL